MNPDFETIEKVDLRLIRSHEAHDFTPWLANNLDKFGEAIGIAKSFHLRHAPTGGD